MPSYFYHIKLELYPRPNPDPRATSTLSSYSWLPPKDSDVFGDLESSTTTISPSGHIALPAIHDEGGSHKTPQTSYASICSGKGSQNDSKNIGKSPTSIRSDRQVRSRAKSSPSPTLAAGIGPHTAFKDWRFGELNITSFDTSIKPPSTMAANNDPALIRLALGPIANGSGADTKARMVNIESKNTDIGWGIVHLYREGVETPALGRADFASEGLDETECTTLCIPAVPSYMTPDLFLGWSGSKWTEHISHFRLVMTADQAWYLVLLKFKDAKKAKMFMEEFNGKWFDVNMTSICHIVYIRSIIFETPHQSSNGGGPESVASPSSSLQLFQQPATELVELPTCPVCLERMDDTTGLMTTPCQHMFHCKCLQQWKGSGCPVCRHSNSPYEEAQASPSDSEEDPSNPYTQPFGRDVSNFCAVCECIDDLWVCLICGHVGCGRYKGGHAKEHWKDTAHCFALEIETQHVWDYAEDVWVHRIIREKGQGKVVDMPHRSGRDAQGSSAEEDNVPRAKMEAMRLEYSNLLTSALESQRTWFGGLLDKAIDKADLASAAAEEAAKESAELRKENKILMEENKRLVQKDIPDLERQLERERKRADKATELAKNLSKSLQEERTISQGLMERVKHLEKEVIKLKAGLEKVKEEKAELEETNRDLTMFISGQAKLKEMEEEGELDEEELLEGTASAPSMQETGDVSGSGRGGGRGGGRRRGGRGGGRARGS